MRPVLGRDPALGLLLDGVVADGGCRGQGVLDVLLGERLEERLPGVLVLHRRRMSTRGA